MKFPVSIGPAVALVTLTMFHAQAEMLYPGPVEPLSSLLTPAFKVYDYRLLQAQSGPPNVVDPKPQGDKYAFSYDIAAPDGRQSRQESGDALGNVNGQYSFKLNDGRMRNVKYTAGRDGFKASIESNEQGLEANKDPADVTYSEPAPTNVPTVSSGWSTPGRFAQPLEGYALVPRQAAPFPVPYDKTNW
ncbi:hypothetical protein BIW11_11530 [Tropilaelaps mercedesae]|uniref:Cuticle protein 10.9-like n=1 Tax=Tropilaelaps mercedesae TaxID=418985 RepID=A0A1V9XAN6_9ACAR|nr:hypothetical protein BIW11_11530 [Tropilaelaps mercedesae]